MFFGSLLACWHGIYQLHRSWHMQRIPCPSGSETATWRDFQRTRRRTRIAFLQGLAMMLACCRTSVAAGRLDLHWHIDVEGIWFIDLQEPELGKDKLLDSRFIPSACVLAGCGVASASRKARPSYLYHYLSLACPNSVRLQDYMWLRDKTKDRWLVESSCYCILGL